MKSFRFQLLSITCIRVFRSALNNSARWDCLVGLWKYQKTFSGLRSLLPACRVPKLWLILATLWTCLTLTIKLKLSNWPFRCWLWVEVSCWKIVLHCINIIGDDHIATGANTQYGDYQRRLYSMARATWLAHTVRWAGTKSKCGIDQETVSHAVGSSLYKATAWWYTQRH